MASKLNLILINLQLSGLESSIKLVQMLAALTESSILSMLGGQISFDTLVFTSSISTKSLDTTPPLAQVAWNARGSVLVWAVSKQQRRQRSFGLLWELVASELSIRRLEIE